MGIIAVFFPDLLNLQKEKMETLKMDVVIDKDVQKFYDFLTERSKDGKVFELDVIMPAPAFYGLYDYDVSGNKIENKDIDYEYSERVHLGNNVIYPEGAGFAAINSEIDTLTFNFEPLEDEYEDYHNEGNIVNLHWWDYKSREIYYAYQEEEVELSPIKQDDNAYYYATRWKEFHFPKKSTYIPMEGAYIYPRLEMLNGKSVAWATGIKGVFYVNEDDPSKFELVSKELLKLKDY